MFIFWSWPIIVRLPIKTFCIYIWFAARLSVFFIVNRLEWLWNPSDSFVVCFCGLKGCTKFNRIPSVLILLTNENVLLIYSVTICQQKTKDFAPSRSFQHKRHCVFMFNLMVVAFHNQSPLITMVFLDSLRVLSSLLYSFRCVEASLVSISGAVLFLLA